MEVALAALDATARAATRDRVTQAVEERERLQDALTALPGVRRVYRSHANFVLVRFDQAQQAFDRLLAAGIVVRDMRAVPGLGDALRISVGTPEQNAAVLRALGGAPSAPPRLAQTQDGALA